MTQFLIQDLKYLENQVNFVPLSGFTGENILSLSETCEGKAWYEGPTLYDILEKWLVFNPQNRQNLSEKALRASVRSLVESSAALNNGEVTLSVAKKDVSLEVGVIQGVLSKGSQVGIGQFSATGVTYSSATVVELKDADGQDLESAGPRDKVIVKLSAK